MRKAAFGLAIVAASAAVIALQGQGVLLRRELKENAKDVYKVEIKGTQNFTVPGMGEQQMGMTGSMTYAVKTGKVDAQKGEAEAEMVTSDLKFELEGPMAGMAPGMDSLPKEIVVKGKLDSRNRLVPLESAGIDPQMLMMMGSTMGGVGQGVEFPEAAVKIGDSWEVVLPKSPFLGNKEHKLSARLVGEKSESGAPVYEIVMEGKIPLDIDLDELMKSMPNSPASAATMGMKVLIKGSMDMKVVGLYEKSSGRALKIESTMGGAQTVELPDMGMSLPVSGQSRVLMTLQR